MSLSLGLFGSSLGEGTVSTATAILLDGYETLTNRTGTNADISLTTGSRKVQGSAAVEVRGRGTSASQNTFLTPLNSQNPADWGLVAFCVDFGDAPQMQEYGALTVQFRRSGAFYSPSTTTNYSTIGNRQSRGKRWVAYKVENFVNSLVTFNTVGAGVNDSRTLTTAAASGSYGGSVVVDALVKKAPANTPMICLGFDDAKDTQYTVIFPLMQARGFVGTAYVPSALVGTASSLTKPQLQEMADAGWAMACDGTPDDKSMLWQSSVANAVAQLDTCAQWVRDNLVTATDATMHFCYPYGSGAMPELNISRTITANGTATITTSGGTNDSIAVGQYMVGTNVPAGRYIVSIPDATTIVMNDTIPATVTSATFIGSVVSAITANNTTTVTMASTANLVPGMVLTGYTAPANNAIVSVDSATQITMTLAVPTATVRAAFTDPASTFYYGKLQDALIAAGYKCGRSTVTGVVYSGFGVDPLQDIYRPGQTSTGATAVQMLQQLDSAIAMGSDLEYYFHSVPGFTSEAEFTAFLDGLVTRRDAGLCRVVTVPQRYAETSQRSFELAG